MFEFIRGKVEYVCPEYIVIENHGIGYQIMAPNPFIYTNESGKDTLIYTYHYVREDVAALYGFKTREEKALFARLLNVSGIGPKGALAILASGQPEQVVQAIENEDEAYLVKFPGVGKKTARQMILDLRGKLQDLVPDFFPNLFSAEDHKHQTSGYSHDFDEAMLALKALGYSEKEINKIMPELRKEQLSTDQYIKKALQKLLK
ncbi:Holliday junction branch migration protein RuvA [Bacillus sp. T33-2]|uniref:Holliday junction branch migration protein RuvA n=1 Tax=Bacillus sp. T33-2 TaxID=2054168 RepID=UPI000C75E6D6|nr:Holliday junction branch migration protein RuvA [Bacillus sp. T33-2]PLR93737.1 Holliday junction branch migration protein RuvA [Bacillus sp. T33-2]